jgi:hypothetical protein
VKLLDPLHMEASLGPDAKIVNVIVTGMSAQHRQRLRLEGSW